jgi:hypothetical protein
MKPFPAPTALRLGFGLGIAVFVAGGIRTVRTPARPDDSPRVAALILDIHREVKEMGPYPGEDFVRREFFIGEDDDDTNKDVHAVIIIQTVDGGDERMRIQVTKMERSANDPKISYARGVKNMVCRVSAAGEAALLTGDYTAKELEPVLRDLKRAILDKKRLLKSR